MARDLVRVLFELEPDAWHGSATERLWAEPVSGGRFRLRNTPFFAFGVSAEDVVRAERKGSDLVFSGVSLRGGHSSYRLKVIGRADEFAAFWKPLELLGCTYEEGRVLAVDVPSTSDIYQVYKLLEIGENADVWNFEEGHCGHPIGEAARLKEGST